MPDKPTVSDAVIALLAKIKDGNLTGSFSVELTAKCGGVLPDSLKLVERKRIDGK